MGHRIVCFSGEDWPPMSRSKRLCQLLLALGAGLSFWLLAFRTSRDEFAVGQAALVRQDWAEASRQIQRLRQRPEYSDQVQLLRGGLLLRTGEPRGAIAELSRVKLDGELREQSQLLLCEAFYQLKQWNNAVAVGRELLRNHPDHVEAHRWLGATYFDLGDLTQAEFHLKELGRLAPTDYSPHRLLGVIHKDFEQYKEAIADFRQALECDPPPAVVGEIRLDLAKSLIQQNLYEDALQTLEIQWPSNRVEPHVLSVECHWAMNRREEAKRELNIARQLAADDPQVLWITVRIALDEERTADALQLLQQLVEAEPTNHQALYEISLAYRRLGKEAEAQEFLERRNVARALFERLVELNKQAIKEPLNADVRFELAIVCDQLGKKELAAVWHDAAAALKSGQNGR